MLSRHAGRDQKWWPPRRRWVGRRRLGRRDRVRGSADGCDVVLHVAGIADERPPTHTFQSVNIDGTRYVVLEAERAGVKKVVYVSSLGADRGQSDYHRSKFVARRRRARVQRDWVVLRPGAVYGPGDEHVSVLLQMIRSLPVIPTIGDGNQRFQPMWHEDLGEALGHVGRARHRPMLHARDCGPGPYVAERSHRSACEDSPDAPRRRRRCPRCSRRGVCARSTRSASAFRSPKRSFEC